MRFHPHHILARLRKHVAQYRREIVPGREIARSIDFAQLMCPLRYDIRVRIDFLRLLRDEWDSDTSHLDLVLQRPEARTYYVWFHEVVCARFKPRLYGHEALVRPAFLKRVQETAALWRSFERQGYDLSKPVHLSSGRSIRQVHGKAVHSEYFAGDGCHRMACLYLAGQVELEPEQYEVEVWPNFTPLDNTALLLQHGAMDQAAYLRFVSSFYCDGLELESVPEILRHVAAGRPELLPELESILAFDLGGLPAHG